MKRTILGLIAVATLLMTTRALAHGHGYHVGFYGVYRPYYPAYVPYYYGPAYYPPPPAYYYPPPPPFPVYPAYPVYPAPYPGVGAGYYSPSFSISVGR